ncbi:hypothetical protein Ndes2526A_g02874 [Nannochloris sp. 'desiccata']|nr:hypothetical protein KSW81_006833 [Chlorella desiccata (nom. nud.)]
MTRRKRSSNAPASSSPPAFRFEQPQGRIDWTALDRIDIHRLVKDADLDTLEQILPSVAHGNLRKYSLTEVTPQSLRRLCELSQLAVQYLLYVQDRLAADVKGVKGQLGDAIAEVGALQASVAGLKKDVDAAEKEAKHSRRMLRIAMAHSQIASTTSVEQQVPVQVPVPGLTAISVPAPLVAASRTVAAMEPPRVIPADPEAVERLKRLEDGIKELLQWKQGTSNPLQPLTTQAPHWNGSDAEDISPRAAASAPTPPAPGKASQILERFSYQPPVQSDTNPLQRQPSSNFATTINSSIPPLTKIHTRSASDTPPRSPAVPTSPHKQPLNPQIPASTPAIRSQFLQELSHEAVGHERPGVISRFPHPLSDLRAVRQELQSELESELVSELAAQGIHDPEGCRGLTPAEYLSCMEVLQQRRAAAANQMNEQDKARERYMRKTVMCHVDAVTKSVAAATKTTQSSPLPLPPQTRPTLRPTTLRVRTTVTPPAMQSTTIPITNNSSMEPSPVDLAMLEVRDQETDAFYSPLRRGPPSLNDGGMPGPPETPSRRQQPTLVA